MSVKYPLNPVKNFQNSSHIFLNSPNVEFFVKRIKAQADLQFVKIFGD